MKLRPLKEILMFQLTRKIGVVFSTAALVTGVAAVQANAAPTQEQAAPASMAAAGGAAAAFRKPIKILVSTTAAFVVFRRANPENPNATEQDNSQAIACRNGEAATELRAPKGVYVGIRKSWKCDGRGGYNGKFQWVMGDDGVWPEMLINWESGRRTHKKMVWAKQYTYNGAYGVYMRACDSSGCGGWW